MCRRIVVKAKAVVIDRQIIIRFTCRAFQRNLREVREGFSTFRSRESNPFRGHTESNQLANPRQVIAEFHRHRHDRARFQFSSSRSKLAEETRVLRGVRTIYSKWCHHPAWNPCPTFTRKSSGPCEAFATASSKYKLPL